MDPNVRYLRIYPTGETDKNIKNLKTVGIKLSKAFESIFGNNMI